jgi:RHH-type proline utilization regulon transcriptional repressor/proline dehydrogenase/delta 1-pyrroline-5-carboxylate dehydrogenase
MLEGMSESARLAINEISKDVILYAPTAAKEQFTNAIAYLWIKSWNKRLE